MGGGFREIFCRNAAQSAARRGGEKAMFVKTLKAIIAVLFAVPFQSRQSIVRIAGGGGFGDEDADFCKKGR